MLQLKHTTRIHVRYMYFEMLFSARNELYFLKDFSFLKFTYKTNHTTSK